MQKLVVALFLCAAVAGSAIPIAMLPRSDDPSPENTLRHFLYALKTGDYEKALELYDPAVWEGTEFEDAARDNLRDLEAFMERTTPEELESFYFTVPVEERPVPEAEAAYDEFGVPEAYDWPHLKVILYLEDEEGGIEEDVERVYIMVPTADGWKVGYWFNNEAVDD